MSRRMLCVGVLGVLTLSVFTSGCSNAPEPSADSGATGTADLPLTAQSNGVQYRLAQAQFTITGETLSFKRVITPPANLPIDQEVLPSGTYSIQLADGWQLQARAPGETTFSAVDAVLASDNPVEFTVTRGQTVDVVFAFISGGIPITLSKGRANVRISVSDCAGYNGYTATLAGLTLDCLNTLDQNSYLVDDNGFLARNFTECVGNQLTYNPIDEIDALLGLQFTDNRDPISFLADNPLTYAQTCLAGQWAQWREDFDSSGTTVCPVWTKQGENAPSAAVLEKLARSEPQLPFTDNGTTPSVLAATKINSIYTVAFPDNQGGGQKCGTAGNCAALCAGGLPGLVISQDGDSLTTDPPPWNDPTNFQPNPDPYQPSYYHMMSFYGPLPGALFGAAARADGGDECSVYVSGQHQLGNLVRNCRLHADGTQYACVSICTPTGTLL